MATAIVGVDGGGGAGKSTLAARLSENLDDCPVIHTDDFASWDNPLNWYPRLLEQVLLPLSRNQLARFQRYDWTERKLSDWQEVSPCRFLILEGVSAIRTEFRPYLAYLIFVATDRSLRLKRGLERDGEDMRDDLLEWMAEEDDYFARDDPMTVADLVVSGNPLAAHLPPNSLIVLNPGS